MVEDSAIGYAVIHGLPTDSEGRHVHDNDGAGLAGGACGVPGVTATAGRQGPQRSAVSGSAALFLGSQHHLAGTAEALRQMEQCVEEVQPIEQGRGVRDVFRPSGLVQLVGALGADVRFDGGSGPRFGGRRKRGQHNQALGRSRGGFSTKIHLKTDFDGDYLAFDLSGGEKGDAPQFPVLLDLGPDIEPRAVIGDKGYDSNANRLAARQRGIAPVIPYKSNARNRPAFFPKALYKARARIEQAVGKLKRFKRIALRCEKTARNFLSFVQLAAGFILLQSVHTT